MKKLFLIILLVLLSLSLFAMGKGEDAHTGLKVVTSFYPLYDFTSKIAEDKVELTMLVPNGVEPHDWEPTAKDLSELERANLLILNGGAMETWAEEVVSSLSNKQLKVIVAGENLETIPGDSHYWLSPKKAYLQMEAIANALIKLDEVNASFYQERLSHWKAEFEVLDKEYSTGLENLSSRDLVVSHEAFGYLCAEYNLNQIAIEGLSPDSEPSPSRLAEIARFVKEKGIRVIFSEELVSDKVAKSLAAECACTVELLSPLEALGEEGGDYFSVMRSNLAKLEEALR